MTVALMTSALRQMQQHSWLETPWLARCGEADGRQVKAEPLVPDFIVKVKGNHYKVLGGEGHGQLCVLETGLQQRQ